MKNIELVDDIPFGVYVWKDANGKYVVDSDYNYMCIPSRKGDLKRIAALQRVAEAHGIVGGTAEFRSGARPISDAEWEEQMARQAAGEVPDQYDLGSLIEDYKYQKEFEGK